MPASLGEFKTSLGTYTTTQCLPTMHDTISSILRITHTKKRMGAFYVIIAKEALVIDTTTIRQTNYY